jgi:hypothetical protein
VKIVTCDVGSHQKLKPQLRLAARGETQLERWPREAIQNPRISDRRTTATPSRRCSSRPRRRASSFLATCCWQRVAGPSAAKKLGCYSSFLPRYSPINIGVPLQASRSDLVSFEWSTNSITADFILPDDDAHMLRVSFDKQCIVRILDEMPLSTEENDTPNEGLVSEHFAYPRCVSTRMRHRA